MRGAAVARGCPGRGLAVTRGGRNRAPLSPPSDGLDPLLATADGLWRTSQLPDDWVYADTFPNEGAAGSAIDLVEYDGVASDGSAPGSTPTLETTGDRGVEVAAANPLDAEAEIMFQAGHHASLSMAGSFTIAFDYTPLTVDPTVESIRYLRKIEGGIMGNPGFVFEDVLPGSGDTTIIVADGDGFTPVTDAAGYVGADVALARYTIVVVVTPTSIKVWRDGVALSLFASDRTGMGSIDNTNPLFVGVGLRLHNLAWWSDDLADADAASLDAKLRAA